MMYSDELTQLQQRWLREMRGRVRVSYSDKSIDSYVRQFDRFLRELAAIFPDRGITLFDVTDIRNVGDALARVPHEQFSTRYQIYCAVSVFFRFLEQQKVVERGLRRDLHELRPKRKGKPKQTFFKTQDEIETFFRAVWTSPGNAYYDKQLLEAVLRTLLNTGMRRTELCSLSLGDVAVERCVIEIRFGKGGKPRKLGINSSLQRALRKYLECRPQTKCDRFFVTFDGMPIRPEGLSRRIMRVARRAGLDVTTHSFRRTAATIMALNGTSLPVIQGVLGHTTETMANQYVKLTEQNIVESMQGLAGIGPRESVHEMHGREAVPMGRQRPAPVRTITARVVKKLS